MAYNAICALLLRTAGDCCQPCCASLDKGPSPMKVIWGPSIAEPHACRAAWAAGTGYGRDYSTSAPIWDAKHAEASQAAQDAELEKLLNELAAGGLAL